MKGEEGFTLIELLVAMTAGAFLLAAISWAVSRLSQDLNEAQRGQSLKHLILVSDRLSALISSARAAPSDDFTLSERKLSFTTSPPMSLGAIGPVRAELDVSGPRGRQRLELSLHDNDGRRLGSGKPSILLTDQQQIKFEWRGVDTIDAPVVAVRLVDRAGERHNLLVPTRLKGDPNCQFDPISMTCR